MHTNVMYDIVVPVFEIDNTLEYVSVLEPSSTHVYKVRKNGELYVLKFAYSDEKIFGVSHIKNEIRILEKLKDYDFVPKLLEKYNSEKYIGFLREFIEGVILKPGFHDEEIKKRAKEVVEEIHKNHMANLDLVAGNLILTPEKRIVIIDLGTVVTKEDAGEQYFKYIAEKDIVDLEQFFF